MMTTQKNIIAEKAFHFSIEIIKLHKVLKQDKEYDISRQLLRSATSIGANIEEASAASSKKGLYQQNVHSIKGGT